MSAAEVLFRAVRAWNTDRFAAELKQAVESLPAGSLPLGNVGPNGGAVDDHGITATVLRFTASGGEIHADVGVFYQEIVAGCSCGDEPMPLPAYAVVRIGLDQGGGAPRFSLLAAD